MKRTASIRAVTKSVLYSLTQRDLDTVLEINPIMAEKMRAVAEERLKLRGVAIEVSKSHQSIHPFVDLTFSGGQKTTAGTEPVKESIQLETSIKNAKNSSYMAAMISDELLRSCASIFVREPSDTPIQKSTGIDDILSNEGLNSNISQPNPIVPKISKAANNADKSSGDHISINLDSTDSSKPKKERPVSQLNRVSSLKNELKVSLNENGNTFDDLLPAPTQERREKSIASFLCLEQNITSISSKLNTPPEVVETLKFPKISLYYCPLFPDNKFSRIWVSILGIVYLSSTILFPLGFAFSNFQIWIPLLAIVLSFFAVCDILVKFQTKIEKNGVLICTPIELFHIYLKDYSLFFDIITAFPWIFLVDGLMVHNTTSWELCRVISLINACLLIKILLTSRQSYFTEELLRLTRIHNINPAATKAVNILLVILFYW
jgi:hypothetical protein